MKNNKFIEIMFIFAIKITKLYLNNIGLQHNKMSNTD